MKQPTFVTSAPRLISSTVALLVTGVVHHAHAQPAQTTPPATAAPAPAAADSAEPTALPDDTVAAETAPAEASAPATEPASTNLPTTAVEETPAAAPAVPNEARTTPVAPGSSNDAHDEQGTVDASDATVAPFLRPRTNVHWFPETSANTRGTFYSRAPLAVHVGEGATQLGLSFYGFLQADFIYDTTRSYEDGIGHSLVARSDVYDGTVGRAQFSPRNTRLGFFFDGPRVDGFSPYAVLEVDFFGNQPGHPTEEMSESAYYDSATMRVRHAFVMLDNDYVDILVGQAYDVFGWQNYFFPATAEFLGLPNSVFSRRAQIQASNTIDMGAVNLDLAASIVRPAQRDSSIPDTNAGLRLRVNDWAGISSQGNGNTRRVNAALGVSGVSRQFKVDAFTPPPTQNSNSLTGWGLSVDALVPIISADNAADRGNALTLTGSFVLGSGIGDLMGVTGGAQFPTLPNPAQANPPPEYDGNVDPGLVSFDTQGVLHTIDWQAITAGIQYYLPPRGRVFISANYTRAFSENLDALFPQGGAEIELLTFVADQSQYVDLNIFWDATAALRLGLAGAYSTVTYLDGDKPDNIRTKAQAAYFF